MIGDGAYEVLVVDTGRDAVTGVVRVEVAVVAGPHKGEILSLRSGALDADPVELLGLPGTLTVDRGEPTLVVERA